MSWRQHRSGRSIYFVQSSHSIHPCLRVRHSQRAISHTNCTRRRSAVTARGTLLDKVQDLSVAWYVQARQGFRTKYDSRCGIIPEYTAGACLNPATATSWSRIPVNQFRLTTGRTVMSLEISLCGLVWCFAAAVSEAEICTQEEVLVVRPVGREGVKRYTREVTDEARREPCGAYRLA